MTTTLFVERAPFGVLVGVRVESGARAELLARVHPDEAALAATWGDLRVRTFVAGRTALRAALRALAVDDADAPVLRTARGAPLVSERVRASVTHKEEIAVALACRADLTGAGAFHVGVDVEVPPGPKDDVSRHVLTPREVAELDALSPDARRREVLLRFSLKEALYKALDPFVQRYVGFHEVEVRPRVDGGAAFTLALKDASDGAFAVEGEHREIGGAFVTMVQVRRP